jgi:hypothetical protein
MKGRTRMEFIKAAAVVVATPALLADADRTLPETVAGIPIPSSPLAVEAFAIGRSALRPELFNHSLRTFVFAELIAKKRAWDHDAELVFVASILHDTGLAPEYMSDRERFEVDGARVAKTLLTKHAVSPTRQELVWDAITLHDSAQLARWKAHEVALVSQGVGADFGGSQDLLEREDVVAVLTAAPRDGFIAAFLPAVAAIAKHKPFATGGCFVQDVGYRLVPGFHQDNFCDEVTTDPFAGYAPA